MAAYNAEKFLEEQLNSLLGQTILPDEFVVCDDGSTDKTLDILEAFSSQAPFPVKILKNVENRGLSSTLNNIIKAAQGDILINLDADDVMLPDRIARILDEFENHPDIGFVFSNAIITDSTCKNSLGEVFQYASSKNLNRSKDHNNDYFFTAIFNPNAYGATLAFKKCFEPLIIPMPCHITSKGTLEGGIASDQWITIMVSAVAPCRIIDKPLLYYRQHDSNLGGAGHKNTVITRALRVLSFFLTDYTKEKNKYETAKTNQLNQLQSIKAKLLSQTEFFFSQEKQLILDKRINHLQTLTSLPSLTWKRWFLVFKEILTIGQHNYAFTRLNILYDLFPAKNKQKIV